MTRPLSGGRSIEAVGNDCPRLMIGRASARQNPAYKLPFSFFYFLEMQLELVLSPALYDYRVIRQGHLTVAVDVLRATTSICAAFQAGASEVVPLADLESLPSYFERGYTLAAERDGKKVGNTQCGNSPTEYLQMDLRGKRLAYSTTNGTVSILLAKDSQKLAVGSFSNLSALSEWIVRQQLPIVILCSGWKKSPCLEDTLFGGALVDKISKISEVQIVEDSARMALNMWREAQLDIEGYCRSASHVARLHKLNYDHDVSFAFRLDTCPVVPVYNVETQSLMLDR